LFLGGLAVGAGIVGKRVYDGPIFSESVDLTGKVIAITGANTGLGKESALFLAKLGRPEIVLLCRNEGKAKAAAEEIRVATGNPNLRYILCDLEDLSSVKKASAELRSTVSRLDVLQLNSGVMAVPIREVTMEGFERQIGVNHLGHFALARELFPLLSKTLGARVVTVSSSAHLLGKIDRDDLMREKEGAYKAWDQYGASKLANILFARELNRRLQKTGNPKGIVSACLHPGVCRTELGRYIFDPETIPKFLAPVLGVIGAPAIYLTKSAFMGSMTQTFLSASATVTPLSAGGQFFDNSRVAETSAAAKNLDDAGWLWRKSEELTGGAFVV